jgi:hypothetical protein
MQLGIYEEDFNVEFTYYKFDAYENAVVYSNDLSQIEFNPYDLVFKSRNRYTPVVVRMAVSGEDLPEGGTITARITRDTRYETTVDVHGRTEISKYASSIMRFTPYIGDYYSSDATIQYNNIDSDSHYNATRALVGDDPSGSLVFSEVTLSSGNVISRVDKDDYIDLTYNYTSSDITNGVLYLYIYITYDEGASGNTNNGLVGIYQRTSGVTEIGEEAAVPFDYDLVSIVVSHD